MPSHRRQVQLSLLAVTLVAAVLLALVQPHSTAASRYWQRRRQQEQQEQQQRGGGGGGGSEEDEIDFDPYEVLGVPQDATQAAVRRAFRKLVGLEVVSFSV